MRKASESSSSPLTSSELTGTRRHKGECWGFTMFLFHPTHAKETRVIKTHFIFCVVSHLECGWALCFHAYQRAAVQVQGSRLRSSRGTCWSTWQPTVRQSLRSGFSGSRSMTSQRPGEERELWKVCCERFKVFYCHCTSRMNIWRASQLLHRKWKCVHAENNDKYSTVMSSTIISGKHKDGLCWRATRMMRSYF